MIRLDCPDCHGSGRVDAGNFDRFPVRKGEPPLTQVQVDELIERWKSARRERAVQLLHDCPSCEGSGYLLAPPDFVEVLAALLVFAFVFAGFALFAWWVL